MTLGCCLEYWRQVSDEMSWEQCGSRMHLSVWFVSTLQRKQCCVHWHSAILLGTFRSWLHWERVTDSAIVAKAETGYWHCAPELLPFSFGNPELAVDERQDAHRADG